MVYVSLFMTLYLCACPGIILNRLDLAPRKKIFVSVFLKAFLDSATSRQLCTSFLKAFSAKDVNLANACVSILMARYS